MNRGMNGEIGNEMGREIGSHGNKEDKTGRIDSLLAAFFDSEFFVPIALFLAAVLLIALFSTPVMAEQAGNSQTPAQMATQTATRTAAPSEGSVSEGFQAVDLKEMVPNSRMPQAGQHAYFTPSPVKFRARLAAMPRPVKTELLKKSMALMNSGTQPRVSQAIGIDYGGDKALLAYIDNAASARLAKELKIGDERTFYAYHVYNFHKGPAFIVVSYE